MRMNRRNVLMGLGTIVVGGGAALGTGAFSSVEADRTVDIGTAGDASGLIKMVVNGDLAGEEDDLIKFQLGSDVNLGAKTKFTETLTITNRSEGAVTIDISDSEENSLITDTKNGESLSTGMNFVPRKAGGHSELSADSPVTFNVIFEFSWVSSEDSADASIPDAVTITATNSE